MGKTRKPQKNATFRLADGDFSLWSGKQSFLFAFFCVRGIVFLGEEFPCRQSLAIDFATRVSKRENPEEKICLRLAVMGTEVLLVGFLGSLVLDEREVGMRMASDGEVFFCNLYGQWLGLVFGG